MRATLETLPTELKTRIAKLCSEADTSWRDCKEAIKSRQDTDYRVLATIERESTYHGQSLKTLSRVSKNWREISVPMLFQTIELGKCTHAIFLFDLFPRYASSFVSAQFLAPLPNQQMSTAMVDVLLRLPRIVSLTFALPLLVSTFQVVQFPPDPDASPYADEDSQFPRTWRALESVLSRVEALKVQEIDALWRITPLLPVCSNLRSLELTGEGLASPGGGIASLSEVLKAVTTLRCLRFSTQDTFPDLDLSPIVPSDPVRPDYPPLTTLSLSAAYLHASWLPFSALFATSLTSLAFESTESDEENFSPAAAPPFDFTGTIFPRLASLTLSAFRSVTAPILLSAKKENLPQLVNLSLGMHFFSHKLVNELDLASNAVLFDHAKRLLPRKNGIRFFDKYWSLPPHVLKKARSLRIETTSTSVFPAESLVEEDGIDGMRNDLPKAINRAIDFLLLSSQRASASGSNTEWRRLGGLLRDVELERAAMRC